MNFSSCRCSCSICSTYCCAMYVRVCVYANREFRSVNDVITTYILHKTRNRYSSLTYILFALSFFLSLSILPSFCFAFGFDEIGFCVNAYMGVRVCVYTCMYGWEKLFFYLYIIAHGACVCVCTYIPSSSLAMHSVHSARIRILTNTPTDGKAFTRMKTRCEQTYSL